jgi:hypothetical protein
MDFDLKELGVTLIIGAYCLFGVEVLLYLMYGSNVLIKIEKSTQFSTRALLALSVTICFALGMLMEDVSDKFVDRDTWMQKLVMSFIPYGQTDDEIKLVTLYGNNPGKIDPLAREVASRGLLSLYGGRYGGEVETAIMQDNLHNVSHEKREEAAKRLYYHAKNVVYKEPTYYDELKRIQLRIDFSRSFMGLSAFFVLFTIILAAARTLKLTRQWKGKHRRDVKDDEQLRSRLGKLARIGAYAIVFFMVSCALGYFSYKAEERQFNSRAFGYFSSMQADQSPPKKALPTV